MIDDSTALEYISEFYLSSHDFNGVPIRELRSHLGVDITAMREMVARLVKAQDVDLLFGNVHPNPHIKAFSHITHEPWRPPKLPQLWPPESPPGLR